MTKNPSIAIGDRKVGPGWPAYIVGEIGINHNGDLDIACRLIDMAADAGCDAVKFQKRTPELCVPPEQKYVMRVKIPIIFHLHWSGVSFILGKWPSRGQ